MRGVILAPIQEVLQGQEFAQYPPHITLVPPFAINEDNVASLCYELDEVGDDWLPIRIVGEDLAEYGDKLKAKARQISGWIFGCHAGTTAAVKRAGGVFDERYTALNWSPHITGYEAIPHGKVLAISGFAMFTSLDGIKKVIYTYKGKKVEVSAR